MSLLDRLEHRGPRLWLSLGSRCLGLGRRGTCWRGGTGGRPPWAPAPPAVAAAAIAACGAMPYFGRTTPVTELGE